MKNYFWYTTGIGVRLLRGLAGIGIEIFGYANYQYPYNLIVVTIGLLILTAAAFNISVLAPLFGYPLWGEKMHDRHQDDKDNKTGEPARRKEEKQVITKHNYPVFKGF